MIRGFGVWDVWTLPVMYTVFRDLRFLAIQVRSGYLNARITVGG